MHYLNYNRIFSYNIPVNVIITARGYGKSYGAKEFVIKQFLKKGSQFLYLRRYENEIKSVFETDKSNPKDFFDDIKEAFPNHSLKAKNRKFYIDDECFGFAKRMTEAQDLKSSVHKNVKTIIIDEYPIEENKRYYLPNEGMILMSLFDSVIRNRSDIRIIILGNAVQNLEYSPLFSFFGLSLPYNNDIKLFKDNTILVHYGTSEEFMKDRENTLIGKLAKGTPYEKYAIQNTILNKNNNFIEKKKGSSKFSFAFIFEDQVFGVWNDYKEGKIYVSLDYLNNSPHIYSMTLSDHRPNTMMFNALKRFNFWKKFVENFKLGNVYYENQKIKHSVYQVIKLYFNR